MFCHRCAACAKLGDPVQYATVTDDKRAKESMTMIPKLSESPKCKVWDL